MKKIILLITMLALTVSLQAMSTDRESLVSWEHFKELVRDLSIPGFSARPQFENDDMDGFQAVYMQGNDLFMVKLKARNYQPGFSGTPYKLEGKEAEFMVMGQLGMLMVDLPESHSILTLASNKVKDQSAMEKIARETGLLEFTPASMDWPARIPSDYRLRGVLIDASEGRDYDAGFSYQVRVTLMMSSQVKESLVEMAGRYSDEGDFLRFPNGIILNYPFSELDSIDEMYGDNDEITFIYYTP